MFESAPQNKIAIAYTIVKPSAERLYIILVFSVFTKKFTSILQVNHEVTQMCTSGSDNILVVATVLGSMILYDLDGDLESNHSLNA